MKFTFGYNGPGKASPNGKETGVKKGVMLTKREMEVLELVAKGFTAQEIADEMFVSINTVETHRRNIVQKMKARNTAHAVAVAVKRKLI